jgi:UDP:flavonoid glycosyltransferase YjiC (YdhE family)
VAALAKRWEHDDVHVVFATLGKRVLDSYPANWTVRDRVDQQRVLSAVDVFVTHGGSNSFHEAVLLRVPVVVVPFFGDQVLIGQRAEELGVGIGLGTDDGIDRDKPKHFLTPALAERIDDAVRLILSTDRYRTALDQLPLEATPPLAELG